MLCDSHCHLDFPDYEGRADEVVARALAAGVRRMVTISTHVRREPHLITLAERHDSVFASVGTHPHHADEEADIGIDDILRWTAHAKVVAIGEVGLDYFYQHSSREAQRRGFLMHIEAARRTGLPIVIHTRDADDDCAAILREEMGKGSFTGVLHCFTGGEALAQQAVALGLYVSFSGILTFKKSDALRAIAANLPAERLLVETDAPFLAPGPYRGKCNEPAFVTETARVLAETRGVSPDTIARQTTDNFHRLFAKVPRAGGSPVA